MSHWISVDDCLPEIGQKVWYHFHIVGTHRGTFDGFYVDEDGKEWKSMHMFSCDYGFLTGDVTHWMPDNGQEKPENP